MKSLYTCLAAALLTMLSVGCSSSSTPAATTGSALSSCEAYCTKAGSSCADAGMGTAAECKTTECGNISAAPANCQGPIQAYYDCLNKQSNVCEMGCLTEIGAIPSTC